MRRFEQTLGAELAGTAALVAIAALAEAEAEAFCTRPDSPQTLAQRSIVAVIVALATWALMTGLRRFGGDHLNPIVAVAGALEGDFLASEFLPAIAFILLVQAGGALGGAWLSNAITSPIAVPPSTATVVGVGNLLFEAIAGAGIALIAFLSPPARRPMTIGLYAGLMFALAEAHGFGNPAIAFGRIVVDGAYHLSVEQAGVVIAAQAVGAAAALAAGLSVRVWKRRDS